MHYPPILVPPLLLSFIFWIITFPWLICTLPTVPSSSQRNSIRFSSKSFLQPPALEETIHEVQKILNQDPSLPRLTRGEIEELYEKVTREEYEKSIRAGDKVRADSMRALMLVLPFNTDNNTEENLQELFTRPPVTKVVDSYSSHQPIQFLTPSMNSEGKFDTKVVAAIDATTYKPSFSVKTRTIPLNPTTYHPSNPPLLMYRMTTKVNEDKFVPFKPLVTNLPQSLDYNSKPVQRFSSHYSAKNAEFLKVGSERRKSTSTIKPVADVLQSLGIIKGTTPTRNSGGLEDYYAAESAPKPSIVSVADLKGVRSQSLGPQIKPDAYSMFKPLNIGEEIRVKPEVEDYLTRFGIVGARKRKAIRKTEVSSTQNSLEPLSQESEIATSKVPSSHLKAKKGATGLGNTELEKLLENLKELEKLNLNPKIVAPTTTTTTTTTTTSTQLPTTSATSLITNGEPMLVEAKKPRRRIDPSIDINVANHQVEPNPSDELSKLLENLQELEKLKLNPERVLKNAAIINLGANPAASKNVPVETPAPGFANRFTSSQALTPQQQLLLFQKQAQTGNTTPDLDQLQKVLQQLQVYEKNNARQTATTSTTTKRPVNPQAQLGPTDLWQLRKLLTDDTELEKLFEQAKTRQQSLKPSSSVTSIRTTTTTTSTTKKPSTSVTELLQLQRYLAELEKANSRVTSTPRTTTSTTPPTTSTTTTTTPKPLIMPQYHYDDDRARKLTMENRELQALIDRVQQLERLNVQQKEMEHPIPTDAPRTSVMGFTTRNVKDPLQNQDYRLPVNDFANLRTLYKEVKDSDKLSQGEIEISTKATAVKAYQDQQLETATRKAQNFAQRIIDITNDTGSGSSLQEVDPSDFVQLHKLLSKVQELERVRINVPTANPRYNFKQETTRPQNLESAASQRTQNIQNPNEPHIVYPSKMNTYKYVEEDLVADAKAEDLKLDLSSQNTATEKPITFKNRTKDLTANEELKEWVYPEAAAEVEAYKNLQPPVIYKTVTKQPPRFVVAKTPKELAQVTKPNADLEEIQKLLSNANELKKLGVSLPKELTQQLETKFSRNANDYTGFKKLPSAETTKTHKKEAAGIDEYLQRFGLSNSANLTSQTEKNIISTPTTAASAEEVLSERTAVFSLTTMKSVTPRPPKTTTESSVELPVFSATKIIEAAIKRAANRIGVSTEVSTGFLRRQDVNINDSDDMMSDMDSEDSDLMADFSEINYQLSSPDDKSLAQPKTEAKELQSESGEMHHQVVLPETKGKKEQSVPDLTANVDELQRLIKNLQELKSLNLSPNDKALLRQADLKYLENLKKQQTAADDTIKTRRQSDQSTEETLSTTNSTQETSTSTTTETSRIQLNLSLHDSDVENTDDTNNSRSTATTTQKTTTTTTEESRNGSLTDLEDSFGPNPITESSPPPKKKNGFYFLADWNSFLEVGDGDDQVVVRFSPKIGDPRLFLPVKIP